MEDPRLTPLWIFVRSTNRIRVAGCSRQVVSAATLYPAAVRQALLQQSVVPCGGLSINADPAQWTAVHDGLNGQVLGLALCKPFWSPTTLTYLTSQQLALQDFWRGFGFRGTLAFVEIIAVASFAAPVRVVQHLGGARPRAMFFKISAVSVANLMGSNFLDGTSVPDRLQAWATAHHLDADMLPSIACAMFPPHAILCAAGSWRSYCFPFQTGRSGAGMGLLSVRALCCNLHAAAAAADQDGDHSDSAQEENLSPDLLQTLSNFLRVVSAELPGRAQEAATHVAWLQKLRDGMTYRSQRSGAKAYEMSHLLNCVMLSGYGKDVQDFKDMCVAALRAVVQDTAVRGYYEEVLSRRRAIPSPTTLYRHRLAPSRSVLLGVVSFGGHFGGWRRLFGTPARWSFLAAKKHFWRRGGQFEP